MDRYPRAAVDDPKSDRLLEQVVCDALVAVGAADRGSLDAASRLAELHVDSFTLVAALTIVETRLGIELPPEAQLVLFECDCVADMARIVAAVAEP